MVGGGHKVVAVVAYLVNACIRANEQRLQSMTTGKGAHLFQVLLRGAERFSEDDSEDAFEMIYEVSTVVAMNTDILRAVVTELQAHLLVGELLTLLRFVDAAQGRVPASSLAALVPTLEWLINLGDASVVSEQILKRAQEGASLLVQTFADRAGEDDESVRVALCDAGVVAPVVRLLRHVHKEAPPLAPSVQVDQGLRYFMCLFLLNFFARYGASGRQEGACAPADKLVAPEPRCSGPDAHPRGTAPAAGHVPS